MLREIGIKNFVLIENLRLEMEAGLNVLTGETGAGKTIVLDAVGLLLGERFRADSVRQGSDKSEVDGIFDAPKQKTFRLWWEDHGFDKADELVIRREGYPDGRSRAFLNDRPVTLGALQELGAFLVDVHGQNEHQQILKPSVQLECLDRFANLEGDRENLEPLYLEWKKLTQDLRQKQLSEQERMQRIDVLEFQLKEIDQAKLRLGEDQELALRLPELKNAEKLRGLAETAYGTLYGEEGSALERLGQTERAFEALKNLAPSVAPLLQNVAAAKASLEESAHELQALAERWEADPAALEEALARQDAIARLERKYGGTVDAVLSHAEKLRAERDGLENSESFRRDLEKRCESARQNLDKASQNLSTKRKHAAKELAQAVQKQLSDLGLKQAVFRIEILPLLNSSPPFGGDQGLTTFSSSAPSPASLREDVDEGGKPTPSPTLSLRERNKFMVESLNYSSTGIDRASFEWAPNPGEGMQPLKTIISGGEMSRVMLALKTVLATSDAIPTLVFDEIDAGIGGLTAQAVGKKLRTLSRHHQVLCVSHLPQIASCAHVHYQVSKRTMKSRTFADVIRLEPTERLQELARLLGSQVTPTSVQHAKELLAQNQ